MFVNSLVVCLVVCWGLASADVVPTVETHRTNPGKNVYISCTSNRDNDHVFMYWTIQKSNTVIGPRNQYDDKKYNYDAISGNLLIRGVTGKDHGIYTCVSEGIENQHIAMGNVALEVLNAASISERFQEYEEEKEQYIWTAVIIILVVTTVGLVIYLGMLQREQYSIRNDSDVESGTSSGIYNSTTTTASSSSSECDKLCDQTKQQETKHVKQPEAVKMLQEHSPVIEV